jgi:hypothetical protein
VILTDPQKIIKTQFSQIENKNRTQTNLIK